MVGIIGVMGMDVRECGFRMKRRGFIFDLISTVDAEARWGCSWKFLRVVANFFHDSVRSSRLCVYASFPQASGCSVNRGGRSAIKTGGQVIRSANIAISANGSDPPDSRRASELPLQRQFLAADPPHKSCGIIESVL